MKTDSSTRPKTRAIEDDLVSIDDCGGWIRRRNLPQYLAANRDRSPGDELVSIDDCGGWIRRRNLPQYLAAKRARERREAAGIEPKGPASN